MRYFSLRPWLLALLVFGACTRPAYMQFTALLKVARCTAAALPVASAAATIPLATHDSELVANSSQAMPTRWRPAGYPAQLALHQPALRQFATLRALAGEPTRRQARLRAGASQPPPGSLVTGNIITGTSWSNSVAWAVLLPLLLLVAAGTAIALLVRAFVRRAHRSRATP